MKLVNLTGHSLAVTDGSTIKTLPSEGKARVVSEGVARGSVTVDELSMPMPVTALYEVEVVGLPPKEEGTLYIVSGIVAAHCVDRDDVVAPGRIIRDPVNRRVIGCQGFVKPVPKVA